MMQDDEAEPRQDRWAAAVAAARLLAVDPEGLGGIVLRARAGAVRDRWMDVLQDALPAGVPVRKLPLHITDDRLLGGLDLAATLRAGRPVAEQGLLARTDGGILVVAMAERMPAALAARLSGVLDRGEVRAEREGFTLAAPARFAVVALDEGIEAEEQAPKALAERLAFRLSLEGISATEAASCAAAFDGEADVRSACGRLAAITVPDAVIGALAEAAEALGVSSPRALLHAVKAARAAAALAGSATVGEAEARLAANLVLGPRATRLPAPPEQHEEPAPPEPPPEQGDDRQDATAPTPEQLADIVLASALAALPPGLLARLAGEAARRRSGGDEGRAGDTQFGRRGRPVGVMRGDPRAGHRLAIVSTLRQAAPWQRLRRRESESLDRRRIIVHGDDLRVRRLEHPAETTAIFVVDASGSAALHRLAEAKGAVELLLADCYARRDRVAVVSFRGKSAEMLLPPTRSLARAKRALSGLPGGGGTPLATAIDTAAGLADAVRRKGQTPVLVFLTDGRANVGRNGQGGRGAAQDDALAAAKVLRGTAVRSLFIDTAPRPEAAARRLADAMDATYLPLPQAGAAAVSAAVRATMSPAGA